MLRYLLRFAYLFQVFAFIALLIAEITIIWLIFENNLPLQLSQRFLSVIDIAMYFSLAIFYKESADSLKAKSKKIDLWGWISVTMVSLHQIFSLISAPRKIVAIPRIEDYDMNTWMHIQIFVLEMNTYVNKFAYLFSTTPNIFFILFVLTLLREKAKTNMMDRK